MRFGERLGVRRTKRTQEETNAWVGSVLERSAESSLETFDDSNDDSVVDESRPVEWTHPPPEFDRRRRRKKQSSVHNEEGRGIGDDGCALLVSANTVPNNAILG